MFILLNSHLHFGQPKDVFTPPFWIKNFMNQDTLTDKKLNSYLPLLLDSNQNWISKNKLKENNNLFIVYKSGIESENLLSIVGKNRAIFLNSDNLKIPSEIDTNGYNQIYGEILDISFGKIEDGILKINDTTKESLIYEIIIKNNLTLTEINEVRTYLSIKYGIDLLDSKKYRYRDEERLWKDSKNDYNLIGIGKFVYFGLFQKESVHSKNDELTIKFSNDNIFNSLKDGDYILIGDNGKNVVFNKQKCLKEWSIQSNLSTEVNIKFNLKEKQNGFDVYDYFLLINKKKYYPNNQENFLIFENIKIDNTFSDVQLFRIKTEFEVETNNTCDKTIININSKDKGVSVKIKNEFGKTVFEDLYTSPIELLTDGNTFFDIEISKNKKNLNKRIFTSQNDLPINPIEPIYYLGDNSLKISINDINKMTSKYNWSKNHILISNEKDIILYESGNYNLRIENSFGCYKDYRFQVLSKDEYRNQENESWKLFPNPALVNNPISNSFDFNEEKDVRLSVFQLDGKLVKNLSKQRIKYGIIHFELNSIGTFIVVAYIDNSMEIKKIIVR